MRSKLLSGLLFSGVLGLLGACAGSSRPDPKPLAPVTPLLGIQSVWQQRVAPLPKSTAPALAGSMLAIASANGSLLTLDAASGRELWRANAGADLVTGAGTDGKLVSAVTRNNELMTFASGQKLWTAKLPALAYTAPLVAGERVFVSLADRSVHAFDGASGRKLWSVQRTQDPLVLQQAGSLQAVGDTLVLGASGRLLGLNPVNGSLRWEAIIANSRGSNEVERLVDVVAGTTRQGNFVCARAFQASVACIDAARGTTVWTKPANGFVGLGGDASQIYASESDGRLIAFKSTDGERLWSTDRYLYRYLSAPTALGRSVVVGDNSGNLHFVSRDNGSVLNRLSTDGSAITAAPVLAGDTLIAVTQNGGIFAFRPE